MSKSERAEFDYYSTDPDTVRALLSVEKFSNEILEPACGAGAISKVLEAEGGVFGYLLRFSKPRIWGGKKFF